MLFNAANEESQAMNKVRLLEVYKCQVWLPLLLISFRSRQRFELWTPIASTHAGSQRHCADPMHGSWILSQMVEKEPEGTFAGACCGILCLGFERLCLAAFCMFQLRLDSPICLSYSCRGDRTGMKLENKWRDTGENNSETVVTPCNSNILDKPLNLIAP